MGNGNQCYLTRETKNLRNFLDGLVSVSLMMVVWRLKHVAVSVMQVLLPLAMLYHLHGEQWIARGPNLLSMYTVEQRGFLIRKYWQTGSFKACQTAFRTEFGERHAPPKCCIQKLIKKLETRRSRSNACRLLSSGPIEGQSAQKYIPHDRTTQRRYTPRDSSRQLWEKYSRTWKNSFECAWMWKETSFSIDYEQVLFCIVPGMCI